MNKKSLPQSAGYLHDVIEHPRRAVHLELLGGGDGFADPRQISGVSDLMSDRTLVLFADGGEVIITPESAAALSEAMGGTPCSN